MDNLQAIMPLLIVTLAAAATMLAEAFRRKGEQMPLGGLGIIGLVGAAVASLLLWNRHATSFGVVLADNFALFVTLVLTIVGVLTIVLSSQVIEREGLPAGEYYTLTLFSLAGMLLMAAATDLLVIFLALEILSLAVYVLTGIRRTDPAGTEAGTVTVVLSTGVLAPESSPVMCRVPIRVSAIVMVLSVER
jgi:NADH-quinone oxidoreductase subunit N